MSLTCALTCAHAQDVRLAPLDGRRRKIWNRREMLNPRDYITRDDCSTCTHFHYFHHPFSVLHKHFLSNSFQSLGSLTLVFDSTPKSHLHMWLSEQLFHHTVPFLPPCLLFFLSSYTLEIHPLFSLAQLFLLSHLLGFMLNTLYKVFFSFIQGTARDIVHVTTQPHKSFILLLLNIYFTTIYE